MGAAVLREVGCGDGRPPLSRVVGCVVGAMLSLLSGMFAVPAGIWEIPLARLCPVGKITGDSGLTVVETPSETAAVGSTVPGPTSEAERIGAPSLVDMGNRPVFLSRLGTVPDAERAPVSDAERAPVSDAAPEDGTGT